MLASGLSLADSMQPPQLPSPFLYRPVEDGQEDSAGGIQARGVHDERTRHFMKVSCGVCAAQHWIVVQEARAGALPLRLELQPLRERGAGRYIIVPLHHSDEGSPARRSLSRQTAHKAA